MEKKFHLIARALILNNNKVLLAHCKGESNTFLPGGHVEIGEPIRNTLKRELLEELNLKIDTHEYLGFIEHYYLIDSKYNHEINHIFICTSEDDSILDKLTSKESHLEFFWKSIQELDDCNLLPILLKKKIIDYFNGDKTIWQESDL
jgi:8-oxo-dGTP pyrophosphatase MutT (NUDIX family)